MGHIAGIPCNTQEFADNLEMTTDNHKENYQWCVDNDIIKKCFNSVVENDVILLLNYPKNELDGYVGASSLMELV